MRPAHHAKHTLRGGRGIRTSYQLFSTQLGRPNRWSPPQRSIFFGWNTMVNLIVDWLDLWCDRNAVAAAAPSILWSRLNLAAEFGEESISHWLPVVIPVPFHLVAPWRDPVGLISLVEDKVMYMAVGPLGNRTSHFRASVRLIFGSKISITLNIFFKF